MSGKMWTDIGLIPQKPWLSPFHVSAEEKSGSCFGEGQHASGKEWLAGGESQRWAGVYARAQEGGGEAALLQQHV